MYEDLYCELAKFGHLLELHVSTLMLYVLFCLMLTVMGTEGMRQRGGPPDRKRLRALRVGD